MKDLMINLFHKPKVFFMLMVICLCPPARTIQTIQACPPDCSAEAAAVVAHQANVTAKGRAMYQARKNMLNASAAVHHWARVVEERVHDIGVADAACYIAATAVPFSPVALIIAIAARIYAGGLFNDAVNAFNNALATYNAAAAAYSTANNAYLDALAALADAQAALTDCHSG